jgi:hypothetical protein
MNSAHYLSISLVVASPYFIALLADANFSSVTWFKKSRWFLLSLYYAHFTQFNIFLLLQDMSSPLCVRLRPVTHSVASYSADMAKLNQTSKPDSCRDGLNGAGVEVRAFLTAECLYLIHV